MKLQFLLWHWYVGWGLIGLCPTTALSQQSTHCVVSSDGPVGFVRIKYRPSGKLSITNESGCFALNPAPGDTLIEFKALSYLPKLMLVNRLEDKVLLTRASYTLKAFTIKANDDRWVKAILQCTAFLKKQPELTTPSYWILCSSMNRERTEYLEGFYNAVQRQGSLVNLALKQGRAGLRDLDGQYFVSLNTSKVFTGMSLLNSNDWIPEGPLMLNKKNLRKRYQFQLKEEINDSIQVISFSPVLPDESTFSGVLTFNQRSGRPIQLVYLHNKTNRHPFQPVGEKQDAIGPMNMTLVWQFSEEDQPFQLIRQSINYGFQLTSSRHAPLMIQTDCVWYQLPQQAPFQLPSFNLEQEVYDYRAFSFLPPNIRFWSNQSPPLLTLSQTSFRDQFVRENRFLYQHRLNDGLKKAFFETRLLIWNDSLRLNLKRVLGGETSNDKLTSTAFGVIPELHLNAGIYMDLNFWGDSLEVNTLAYFNPFDCQIPAKAKTSAGLLLNLYFDLYELERRALMKAIIHDKDPIQVRKLHAIAEENARKRAAQMLFEVGISAKKAAAEKWIQKIINEGGPDNTPLLQLIQEKAD